MSGDISPNISIETVSGVSSVSLSLVYRADTRKRPEMPTVSRVVVQRPTRQWRLPAGADDEAMRIFPPAVNGPKLLHRRSHRRRIQDVCEIG